MPIFQTKNTKITKKQFLSPFKFQTIFQFQNKIKQLFRRKGFCLFSQNLTIFKLTILLMNPTEKQKSRTNNEKEQHDESSRLSESFHYNPVNQKYIGKRTGLLFRRVNPKINFDGFARLSEYQSHGQELLGNSLRDSGFSQGFEQKENSENASLQKLEPKSNSKQKYPGKQQRQSQNSFVYKPSQNQPQIFMSNHNSSSRIPDANIPSFSNISTIKRRMTVSRPSQINTYAKLFDAMNDQDLDQFVVNQDLLKDIQISSDGKKTQHQNPEAKTELIPAPEEKKGRNQNRVSFATKKPQLIQYVVEASKLTDCGMNSVEYENQEASNNFLRKLQESHRKMLIQQRRIMELEMERQRKRKQEEEERHRRQQQRKDKLMKAFKFTEDNREEQNKSDPFSHKTSQNQRQKKQMTNRAEQKLTKKHQEKEDKKKQKQNQQQQKKPKLQTKKRKKNPLTYRGSSKGKNKQKNKQPTSQMMKTVQQKKQMKLIQKIEINSQSQPDHNNSLNTSNINQSEQSSQSEANKKTKGKRSRKTKDNPEIKKMSRKTKIRGLNKNEYIKKIIQGDQEQEEPEQGRYPKRCRVKPTKYWQSQKVNYHNGRVVGITHAAEINFLKLIGADSHYEASININFQNNNIEATVSLPAMKSLSCRGYSDPYSILEINLAARDLKSSLIKKDQITLDDGIMTIDLKQNQKCTVDPDRLFTIENQSKKQVTLLMSLSC